MNSLESFVKFIPSTNTNTTSISVVASASPILTDVEVKAKKLANNLTDVYYIIIIIISLKLLSLISFLTKALYENSNEPSLGLYRIQVKSFFNLNRIYIL
jgi:hypothetical protein